MNRNTGMAALCVGLLCATSVGAQTMYRCGNKYQDRPCDAGQQGKAVGSTGTSQASGGADPECTQRGINAQKIMWAREAGATAEKQMGESPEQGQLIADVYHKRGTAPQVRAAIEADCVAKKEKDAQAAALVKALGLQQPAASNASNGPSAAELKRAEEKQAQENAVREAKAGKDRCDSLNEQLKSNRESMLTGGSSASLDRLNKQRWSIDNQRRDAGC